MFFRLAVLILVLDIADSASRAVQADEPDHQHSSSNRCTAEVGQQLIDQGKYEQAVRVFTCIADNGPSDVEGYRGRIEANLLLGRYSDAVRDYSRITALVLPVHPEAEDTIMAGYAARLAAAPHNIPALTGASFARWWFFKYASAIHLLDRLVSVEPTNIYGNLFLGSSRLLLGAAKKKGVADLEVAILLAPDSADVRFIVAGAYTYGQPDSEQAFAEASLTGARHAAHPRDPGQRLPCLRRRCGRRRPHSVAY